MGEGRAAIKLGELTPSPSLRVGGLDAITPTTQHARVLDSARVRAIDCRRA